MVIDIAEILLTILKVIQTSGLLVNPLAGYIQRPVDEHVTDLHATHGII